MANTEWDSPDGKIKKLIVIKGTGGIKPTENAECNIDIIDADLELDNFKNKPFIIGDNDSELGRLLDISMQTMHVGETANFTFHLKREILFTLKLNSFQSKRLIYEWTAKEKLDLAFKHKKHGVDLFKDKNYIEASHRFGKAIRLLCSIPVEIEFPPKIIDEVPLKEIDDLKIVLYNNLASCYLKHGSYDNVIFLCQKVLENDKMNVKACYKCALAYCNTLDYDKSREYFLRVLELEPHNTAANEKLKFVNGKIVEVTARVNNIVKKMFSQ